MANKNKTLSVQSLCEFIWALEEREDLLNWTVQGVHVWPLIRMPVFYMLSEKTGLYQQAHPVRRSALDKMRLIFRQLADITLHNPFLKKGIFHTALVPHSRKIEGVDIYSNQVMRELEESVLVLDSNINGKALEGASNIDFCISLANFVGRRARIDVDEEKRKRLKIAFKKEFDLDIDFRAIISHAVMKFKILRAVYRFIFKAKKVRGLYIVVAYFHPHIAAAANDLGIQVTELQHGTITPYHLGYSYPGRPFVPYQPDALLCFGSYWHDTTDLPGQMKTRVIGAPHVQRLKAKSMEKIPKSIFFSSQGVIGQQLFAFAEKVAPLLPDYHITFNLHPSEHEEDYSTHLENLKILCRPPDIFDVIAAHEYQAGVFSTTLFEGLTLKTKVILVEMAGAEYMRPLVEKGDAILVKTPEDFVKALKGARLVEDTDQYYAPPAQKVLQR